MIAKTVLALLAASIALSAQADALPLLQQPEAADDEPIPPIQEEGDFYVVNFAEGGDKPDEGMKLDEFVKVCQQATGLNFTYNQETANMLRASTVRMFGSKRMPKTDFYRFFQIMMFINEFATVGVGPEHLRVIVIQSLQQQQARATVKQGAEIVLPDELDNYLDQPATLITTVLTLPNTDVRQLATSLRPLMPDQSTSSMLNAGSSDSLVLTGFGSNIAHFARLLKIIDEEAKVDAEVAPQFDVIPLQFASASDIADLLKSLLEANRTLVENQSRRNPGAEGVAGQFRTGSGDAEILVEGRTNSLIVMALEDDMPRIKQLIARLDVDVTEPERNYHIYELENVSANDLADTLDQFLRDASRISQQGGTGGRAPGQPGTGSQTDDEVVVVPDPETNSLLIAANKTRYEEVVDLVRQLDRRQDQVLIETALIELKTNDLRDIGVELGAASIPGPGNEGGFGVSSFGLSSYTDTDGDGVPDVKVPNITGGLTAGILDGDDFALPVLLAAVQNRDDTNVLNVPAVLVNNNGQATVSTLDERPTTTVTATGGVGGQTQENFAGYQDSGITLLISPSISASRYLRLGVNLTVSNFVGTFSVGTIPPPRITRTLITEVNVPDGDTMVIGGIISDNKSSSEDQIPFLGDIPILEHLFQRKSDFNDRTTLYFFVTPHILHDPDFADLAEISYRKKLEAAEIIGFDRIRMIDPMFGTDTGATGMTSFELPLYRSAQAGESSPEDVGLDPVEVHEMIEGARDAEVEAP